MRNVQKNPKVAYDINKNTKQSWIYKHYKHDSKTTTATATKTTTTGNTTTATSMLNVNTRCLHTSACTSSRLMIDSLM